MSRKINSVQQDIPSQHGPTEPGSGKLGAEGVELATRTPAADEPVSGELLAMQKLQEISTRLFQDDDLDVLYAQFVDAAVAIMRSDMASMQLFDPDRGQLQLLATAGFDPESAEAFKWVGAETGSACGEALRTSRRAIATDVETCDFIAGTPTLDLHRKAGIRAVQSTPLVSRTGRLLGMISTHWRQPHQPAQRELRLFDVLARQAADLIERKQTDEVRARLAAIVESSDDAIVSKDLDGIIKSWNAAAERMFGYTAEEAVGRSITMLLPHDRLDEEPAIIARIRQKERIDHIETVRRRKDGSLIDVSLTISPVVDSQGRIVGVSKTARDITERKRAEQALRESERRFREMIDALPAAIYTTDAEGRLTHFNPAAVEMSGRTPELGTDQWCVSWKLYNPDGTPLPHDKCPMAISLKEGRAVRGAEAIAERPDGSRVWFAPFPTPILDDEGHVVGGINMLVDITERKQAEHALQEADRRKNEFLATLAHELRNPLNPIRNAVESLRIKGPPEPELEQLRDIIDRQVRHLTRLVDDLLDINRIARDQIDLHKQPVELTDVINAAVEMSRPLIDQSGHELSVRLPDDPVWLDGDPARLAQVLMNLLNNAAKYTEPGGQIWLDAERHDGQVAIRVTDTGIGIAPEKLGNLFDLFYQADRSMERSGGGLGIGLALVQRFVEMHGGAVTAHSEGPGMGSQFVVRLPVLAERPAAAAPTDGQRERTAVTRRILVVDDNQDSAKMLATLLRLTGNEVEMAFDGVEALQAGERFGPEVVLLDIGMPRLNGYETCRRMRQQPWGKEALLIAQTGWGQNEDKRRTAEAGFNAHFVKPISLAALNKLLADWQPEPA
jgi:PAS domain S-box-containing protein